MADFTLYIGNRNYSSWSLRGWLMVKASGITFEEILIRLRQPNTKAEVLRHSPSGRVPALVHGEVSVWESLAIGEYLAELFPDANLWPRDRAARAVARSVSTEMHAGFTALRTHFPMNVRSSFANRASTPDVQADIDRITAIWHDCRSRFSKDGPFLFGAAFSNADAMYAPVVSRFRTYKVELDAEAQAYCDAVWSWPPMQEWAAAAKNEPWVIEDSEF
ncbi:MAG TPA: glutathione S-transferase family protein [Stellaceae bacterium]|jgi:glutathione S-transferase|nr:glutathione S-transferase family protein [Stellaceae bacterium]